MSDNWETAIRKMNEVHNKNLRIRSKRLRPERGAAGRRREAAPPSESEQGWGPASSEKCRQDLRNSQIRRLRAQSRHRHLHQMIVRVDVVDVLRRDQLVLDEHGRRHRTAMEDVERDGDDFGAVLLRKIRDRPDESGARCRSSARPSGDAF